jgi:pimeloyl-ACP methyl ester carboxylesterase
VARSDGRNGHGASGRRGRYSLPDHAAVEQSMWRLLETAGAAGMVRSARAEVDGAMLHYLEAGSGSGAAPVVLIHGGGGGAANWFRLIGPLAAKRRVLAPDLPGFGLSPGRHATTPIGESAAQLLASWLEARAARGATLVGTSFGGLAVLRLAQRRPDLAARLVLIDTVGLGRGIAWPLRAASLPLLGPLLLRPSRRGTAWLFRTLLTTDRRSLDTSQQEALIEYLYRSAAAGDRSLFAASLRQLIGLGGQREYVTAAELRAIVQPVALVWGARDRLVPAAHAHSAAAALRRATCSVLPDAGHSPNWEAPDGVLAAIEGVIGVPT